jgi:hypothetical protein
MRLAPVRRFLARRERVGVELCDALRTFFQPRLQLARLAGRVGETARAARARDQPAESETQEHTDRRAERERRRLELMQASDELGDRGRHGRTLPQPGGEVDRRGGPSDSRRQRDDRLIVARNP